MCAIHCIQLSMSVIITIPDDFCSTWRSLVKRGMGLVLATPAVFIRALHWRHNDHNGVSNHQPHGCLLNRLFRRRSKKTSELRVTGLCVGNSPGPVNSPHKGPVTRKMFPFDDVIMGIVEVCGIFLVFQTCRCHLQLYMFHTKHSVHGKCQILVGFLFNFQRGCWFPIWKLHSLTNFWPR